MDYSILPEPSLMRVMYDAMINGFSFPDDSYAYMIILYARYHGKSFRIALPYYKKMIILSDPDLFLELIKQDGNKNTLSEIWPIQWFYRKNPSDTKPLGFVNADDEWRMRKRMTRELISKTTNLQPYEAQMRRISDECMISKQFSSLNLHRKCQYLVTEVCMFMLLGRHMNLFTLTPNPLCIKMLKSIEIENDAIGKIWYRPESQSLYEPYESLARQVLIDTRELFNSDENKGLWTEFNKCPVKHTADFIGILFTAPSTFTVFLQWLMYCLARYPHTQESLRKDESGEYLKALMREQHRRFPGASGLIRTATATEELVAFMRFRQMDQSYVNGDPQLFLPERWLSKLEQVNNYRDYLNPSISPIQTVAEPHESLTHALFAHSFGYGKRQCVALTLLPFVCNIILKSLVETYELRGVSSKTRAIQHMTIDPQPDPEIQFILR